MPTGLDISDVEAPSDVPLDLNTWFWLAVSESVSGRAIMALVRAGLLPEGPAELFFNSS